MTTFLNTLDGTLDSFVQTYCNRREIKLDGDIFGIMFSGKEDYTSIEAVDLIEEAADVYALRITSLADILDNRVTISEARFGKAGMPEVAEIADTLFRERGIAPKGFIEPGIDGSYWYATVSHNGEVLVNESFTTREEAEVYLRAFSTIPAFEGE